jgi:hypothetical protein
MSRRGRFGLRVLAAAAVSFGLLAPPSFGQALSLSGEFFEANTGVPGQGVTFGPFTCNKSGTTTVPFEAQGSAFGPYSGTFAETGSFKIGPQTDTTTIDVRGVGAITDFQATFTVDSLFPTGTVMGTKKLSPPAPTTPSLAVFGSCNPNGPSPTDVVAAISGTNLVYSAEINAVTGSRTDSGTANVEMRSIPVAPSLITFAEAFNSTEPAPDECVENGDFNDDCQGEDEGLVGP